MSGRTIRLMRIIQVSCVLFSLIASKLWADVIDLKIICNSIVLYCITFKWLSC